MNPVDTSCQSCGMPLSRDERGGGTNADGTRCQEYCSHCFQQGKFTEPDLTATEMVAKVQAMLSSRNMPLAVVQRLAGAIASLKRWKV